MSRYHRRVVPQNVPYLLDRGRDFQHLRGLATGEGGRSSLNLEESSSGKLIAPMGFNDAPNYLC